MSYENLIDVDNLIKFLTGEDVPAPEITWTNLLLGAICPETTLGGCNERTY